MFSEVPEIVETLIPALLAVRPKKFTPEMYDPSVAWKLMHAAALIVMLLGGEDPAFWKHLFEVDNPEMPTGVRVALIEFYIRPYQALLEYSKNRRPHNLSDEGEDTVDEEESPLNAKGSAITDFLFSTGPRRDTNMKAPSTQGTRPAARASNNWRSTSTQSTPRVFPTSSPFMTPTAAQSTRRPTTPYMRPTVTPATYSAMTTSNNWSSTSTQSTYRVFPSSSPFMTSTAAQYMRPPYPTISYLGPMAATTSNNWRSASTLPTRPVFPTSSPFMTPTRPTVPASSPSMKLTSTRASPVVTAHNTNNRTTGTPQTPQVANTNNKTTETPRTPQVADSKTHRKQRASQSKRRVEAVVPLRKQALKAAATQSMRPVVPASNASQSASPLENSHITLGTRKTVQSGTLLARQISEIGISTQRRESSIIPARGIAFEEKQASQDSVFSASVPSTSRKHSLEGEDNDSPSIHLSKRRHSTLSTSNVQPNSATDDGEELDPRRPNYEEIDEFLDAVLESHKRKKLPRSSHQLEESSSASLQHHIRESISQHSPESVVAGNEIPCPQQLISDEDAEDAARQLSTNSSCVIV